jgi:hypothetical protein
VAAVTNIAGLHDGLNQPSPFTRVLVLGFYDGATEGVAQAGDAGPVYRFELPADVDEAAALTAASRPFELRPLPSDALDRLATVLTPYLVPAWPVWFARWDFPTEEAEREASARIDAILAEAGPVEWRIATPDPWDFSTVRAERVTAEQRT